MTVVMKEGFKMLIGFRIKPHGDLTKQIAHTKMHTKPLQMRIACILLNWICGTWMR
jgi:hypothetical protein